MPSPSAKPTPITPPRVPIIDPVTGQIDRAWYMFFYSLFNAASSVENVDIGASAQSLVSSYAAELETLAQAVQTMPQPDLGSMAPLMQDNVPWLTFNNAPSPVPTNIGSVYWDGGTTLGVQATANVLMRVGESEFIYVKASAAITKGQLCYHTGAVGSSGVITAAPTPLALADPNQIVGVAAENIPLNAFGLIQINGDLRGFNTTGTSVGETWADGDPLYYNPAYVGSFTKTKPSAPNQKTYVGEVINAGSGGSGAINIRIVPGTILGGTDSNVQFGSLANNNIIVYDNAGGYWKNTATGTGVVTALGVNVGTAGAFVVNGGALGTPSSGTVTNLTGTASININGTVGATTPTTGAFTTVTTTGAVGIGTVSPSVQLTVVGGTTSGAVDNTAVFSGGVGGVTGSGAAIYLTAANGTSRAVSITGVNTGGANNAHDMVLSTSAASATPVERLRVNSSGASVTGAILATTNIRSSGATSGIGYATGAGGTATQGAGSGKATGVTLNNVTGQITMNNAALAANTTVTFTLTNSAIAATDLLVLNHVSGGTAGSYTLNAQAAAGSASINVRNVTAGSLSEAIVIGFAVIKAVTA